MSRIFGLTMLGAIASLALTGCAALDNAKSKSYGKTLIQLGDVCDVQRQGQACFEWASAWRALYNPLHANSDDECPTDYVVTGRRLGTDESGGVNLCQPRYPRAVWEKHQPRTDDLKITPATCSILAGLADVHIRMVEQDFCVLAQPYEAALLSIQSTGWIGKPILSLSVDLNYLVPDRLYTHGSFSLSDLREDPDQVRYSKNAYQALEGSEECPKCFDEAVTASERLKQKYGELIPSDVDLRLAKLIMGAHFICTDSDYYPEVWQDLCFSEDAKNFRYGYIFEPPAVTILRWTRAHGGRHEAVILSMWKG